MPGEPSSVGAGFALDIITGRAAGPGARTMYVALLTAAPSDSTTLATMTELSATGYSRQSAAFSAPSGDPRSTSNTAQLTFGPFTTDPANVTHLALVSAASGTTGDFVWFWTADTARDAAIGDSITIAASALVLNLD